MSIVHPDEKPCIASSSTTCPDCGKTLRNQLCLNEHLRRNHRLPTLSCFHCKYSTKFKFQLAKHMNIHVNANRKKRVHRHQKNVRFPFIICCLCNTFKCKERSEMIQHYVREHDIEIVEESLEFANFDEFVTWKKHTEWTEDFRFVLRGKYKSKNCISTWFRCFRDGYFLPREGRKRQMKRRGSCKINSVCPCSVKVMTFSDTGAVRATYIARHVCCETIVSAKNSPKDSSVVTPPQLSAESYDSNPILDIEDPMLESIQSNECNLVAPTTDEHFVVFDGSLTDGNYSGDQEFTVLSDHKIEIEIVDDFSVDNGEEFTNELERGKENLMGAFKSILNSVENMEELEIVREAMAPVAHAILASRCGLIFQPNGDLRQITA